MVLSSTATVNDARTIWGHKFHWTANHKTESEISHLLYSYDKLATDALDRLDVLSPPKSKSWKCPHGSGEGQRDLYALVHEHAATDELLGQLRDEISTVPDWVDWEQIERGQRIVYQFSGQILLGLLYKSLMGGMGAWRVVETLSRTGGFGVKVTRRRLLETLQHFMEVTENLDAIKPGGKGFISSVRVRLLHASVRRHLMQLEREKPGYFDVDKWGVPINDLHCMGTISVYSVAIVYMALPRQGIYLTERQTADYFALWRWVGYLLGTPVDWMATPAEAKVMMESIMTSEMNPSHHSRILANNILTAEACIPPLYAPRELLVAQAYQLNGDHLAGALGIEKPRWRFRILVWVQCLVLMLMSYSYPWMPASVQQDRDRQDRRRHWRADHIPVPVPPAHRDADAVGLAAGPCLWGVCYANKGDEAAAHGSAGHRSDGGSGGDDVLCISERIVLDCATLTPFIHHCPTSGAAEPGLKGGGSQSKRIKWLSLG
ncbi:hypothetical protein AK830_g6189 [Neonectria ditissima]|uniref:ER-bound oxygenase mpaB/mpaB'/Rubber oxygenase catalytic domain-containing protein n=1 Tax=Neonectria ditissima TaxID=78410 RepID=A0A0P7BCY8_9HYPO|nr:hypothetical protein AK830_g6189 [Neonectria ditissima]